MSALLLLAGYSQYSSAFTPPHEPRCIRSLNFMRVIPVIPQSKVDILHLSHLQNLKYDRREILQLLTKIHTGRSA